MGLFEKVECAACVQKTDLSVGLCYLAKEKTMREVRKRHVNEKFAPLVFFLKECENEIAALCLNT